MTPSRGGGISDSRQGGLEPNERGPWAVVSTVGPFDHTLLMGVTRTEAQQLLDDVRCDDCGQRVSGVPPWETEVVVSQYVCRHCLDTGDEWHGTEFVLIQEGVDIDVL